MHHRASRFLLTAGALLGASAWLYATDAPAPQRRLDYPGTDRLVGRAWIDVQRASSEHVYFKTLVAPTLGMGRTKGSDNMPLGLIKCAIWKRRALVSAEVQLDITLLRCPGNREYVVDEVLFDLDEK
jgi:hypothetical protein